MSDFSSPTGIDWAGAHYGTVRFGEDAQKVVTFYIRSVENPAKSREQGVRICENQVFIRIHEPGERLNVVDRPVQETDKDRWPVQWSRFIQNKAQIPEGTPVDLLFPNNPAVADNLKTHGIHTIQQLAKLSAHAMDTVGMGAQEWVNMADAYLRNANDGSAFLKVQEENRKLNQEIKIQKGQIAKLIEQVDRLNSRNNPDFNHLNPPFIPNYDVQSERLNSNHPTREIAQQAPRRRRPVAQPPADETEQHEILRQVDAKD